MGLIGLIIVSICIGTLTADVWGWLFFGSVFLIVGLITGE